VTRDRQPRAAAPDPAPPVRARARTGRLRAWGLVLPAGVLYAVTFGIPLAMLLGASFARFQGGVTTPGFFLDNYVKIATDGVTLAVFRNTVTLSLLITAVGLACALPVAMLMRRAGPGLRLVAMFVLVSPLLTSIIVRNVAWMLILGRSGMINSWLIDAGVISAPLPLMYNRLGVVIAVVHVYLPFAVLPIYAALRAIDPARERAAAGLGAAPWRVFVHVTLPLAAPGLIAAFTLLFILSMGLYLTPVILGGNFVVTLPMLITDAARNQYNWPYASAMSVLLLASIVAVVAASAALGRLFAVPRDA